MLSALSSDPTTASSLYAYADVLKACVKKKVGVEYMGGFETNDLLEMEESLRYLAERYEEVWAQRNCVSPVAHGLRINLRMLI